MSLASLVLRGAVAAVAIAGALGCTTNQAIDLAMGSAPRHARASKRVGPYEVLGGDLHCHVLPPDAPWHVSRALPETARIAEDEGLDFVVLTPHVPARFFLDPEMRAWVMRTQKLLRADIEALGSTVLLIPGMEYTDHRFGHVGLAFADVSDVLDELSTGDLTSAPARFFERWSARGGLATINHPVLRPIPNAPIMQLHYDLSWRDFPRADESTSSDVFPEIRWLSEHAETIETYNLSIGHLRDRFVIGDPDWTMRESSHLVDRIARTGQRRVTPVGGTDSHGYWLRPTTWVLATERTPSAIREALASGRVCVRSPEACSLQVRGRDGVFRSVGASLVSRHDAARSASSVEARVAGGPTTYFVNGAIAARGGDGELVEVPVPGRCALVRAVTKESHSAPVYVDCPWADHVR